MAEALKTRIIFINPAGSMLFLYTPHPRNEHSLPEISAPLSRLRAEIVYLTEELGIPHFSIEENLLGMIDSSALPAIQVYPLNTAMVWVFLCLDSASEDMSGQYLRHEWVDQKRLGFSFHPIYSEIIKKITEDQQGATKSKGISLKDWFMQLKKKIRDLIASLGLTAKEHPAGAKKKKAKDKRKQAKKPVRKKS